MVIKGVQGNDPFYPFLTPFYPLLGPFYPLFGRYAIWRGSKRPRMCVISGKTMS